MHALAAIRWMVLMAVAAIAGCATVPSPPAAVPKPHPATAVDCRGPAIAKALRGTYTIATQVKRVQGFGVREREMEAYRRLEDVVVYQKLFRLHMPESDRRWPPSSLR